MKYLQSGLVLIAGVLGAASATTHTDHSVDANRKVDVRETILRRFLKEKHSPVESYARNFIQEADFHKLDWRLLPSLAFVESGAGQTSKRNNIFGWNNGESRFSSAAAAIHHVAEALAEARPYKGKDLLGKLAAYNQTPGYRKVVTGVMAQICPVAAPEAL